MRLYDNYDNDNDNDEGDDHDDDNDDYIEVDDYFDDGHDHEVITTTIPLNHHHLTYNFVKVDSPANAFSSTRCIPLFGRFL